MSDKPKLNLAERRAVAAYQESAFAEHLGGIKAAAGFDVHVDVDWDSMAGAGQADHYANPDYWTNVFFVPVIQALTSVTADAMGKEALQEALKAIKFHFDEATAPIMSYENGVSFVDGVLTINFRPFNNADAIEDRTKAMVKVLENNL